MKAAPKLSKLENPYEVCERLKSIGVQEVVLSFSAGKDSIAAWCALREAKIKVRPYYLSIYPVELNIVRQCLDFYEQEFQTRILVLPHPACFYIFKELLFLGPSQVRMMEIYNVGKVHTMAWIKQKALEWIGLPDGWEVVGIKAADSFNRACVLKKSGPIHQEKRRCYPMANCGDKSVYAMLTAHKVKLPDIYLKTGESFDSFRLPVLDFIRTRFPSDWKTIQRLQPLITLEYARHRLG